MHVVKLVVITGCTLFRESFEANYLSLHAAENESPCIVCKLPVSMAGEGEWYNSQ